MKKAFQQAKELLISAPLLHPPDFSKEFYLWTDANSLDFRAALEQVGEDKCCYLVAYASHQTNTAEAKYALQNWTLLML